MRKFPHYRQADAKDCGPTCLKIVAKHYGKIFNIQKLRELSETTREGSNLLYLSDAAEKVGFKTLGVKVSLEQLDEAPLPCVLHWNKNHYVVLYDVISKSSKGKKEWRFKISDPAHSLLEYNEEEFLKFWIGGNADQNTQEGIALLLEPTPNFYEQETINEKEKTMKLGLHFLSRYFIPYKKLIFQLMIGLGAGTLLQLIAPFLTQSLVDIGINNQNMNFVYLILGAQLAIFAGRTGIELIRSWIMLHLSTRINISLISDFFIKLMNLPISFFDVRMTGDIMQRIRDHQRIERILTSSSISVLFSVINMVIMGGILAFYNLKIFLIFFVGSLAYFFWIKIFLKKREELDYKRFSEVSQEQSKMMELINGMQEIKLHNAEKQKRWGWEYIQARLFKVSMQGLILEQSQNIGSLTINELKNILISILSAKLVIDGSITLGEMMAINSIVGGLNAPVGQLIGFVRELQDAKISIARLSEIHDKEDEVDQAKQQNSDVPKDYDIYLENLTFRYLGNDVPVLEDLSLTIPGNKITAIVGTSGSGKTTLLKLLLKFYEPQNGEIGLKSKPNAEKSWRLKLKNVAQKSWREHIGVVMQEGFVFNDTIAHNIALGDDVIDKERLVYATHVANIDDYILELPLGFNTKIGQEGLGMSTGQKQRMMIARAVYKNPNMICFDEATSALDANNEKAIMEKLDKFYENKTVVIIAHRLSTVMNADQIVVLDKGKIVEIGNHEELVAKKGNYFELVKNQLQLGS